MGNIIIGTQSEYLRRCRLALHDVSEGAIPRFCKLGSGFDPASASITTCFCVTSPTHVLLHYGPKQPLRRLQMPSIDNHFTRRHPSTWLLCYGRWFHSNRSLLVSDLARNEARTSISYHDTTRAKTHHVLSVSSLNHQAFICRRRPRPWALVLRLVMDMMHWSSQ